MSWTLTVRKGGGTAGTDQDLTAQIPAFEPGEPSTGMLELGMAFDSGAGAQGQFIVDDDAGEFTVSSEFDLSEPPEAPQVLAHNVVQWTEDAPGYDVILARGRVSGKDVGRNEKYPFDDARMHSVRVDDVNVDLRGIPLREQWVRSAETDTDRVLAVAAYALAGTASTAPAGGWRRTTDITAGTAHRIAVGTASPTVNMPAKTYEVGTEIEDIIRDCAETAGKIFGVVVDNDSGTESHMCLEYIAARDYQFLSAAKISDHDADRDVDSTTAPVFGPIWDQGAAAQEEGQEVSTAVLNRYGSGSDFVVGENTAEINTYDEWTTVNYDSDSVTAVQALARAGQIRASLAMEHLTLQVSVKVKATQVALIAAGQSIQIKAAAAIGGQYSDTYQTRRIASCKWEPVAPEIGEAEGQYLCHLLLDRTTYVPRQPGKGQAAATTPKPIAGVGTASCSLSVDQMAEVSTPNGGFEDGTNTNWPVSNVPNHDAAAAQEGEYFETGTGASQFRYYSGWVGTTFKAGQTYVVRFYASTTGTQINAYFGSGSTTYPGNAATPPAWSGSGDYTAVNIANTTLFSEVQCISWTPSADRTDVYFMITFGSSTEKTYGLQCYTGAAGDDTVTIGGPGEGSVGSGTGYIPGGTTIEHGDLSGKGGTMHDDTQIEVDPTGLDNTDGTNIHEVIVDFDAAITAGTGVTDHGALTGLPDDDHPQYLLGTLGGKGTVNTVVAAGSTETLDLADGNDHDVTLTADCTLTLTGATAGVSCYMSIKLRQDSTGGWEVTWPASVNWVGGSAPTLQTAADTWDRITLVTYDGGTSWDAQHAGTSSGGSDTAWIVDPGSPSYSGTGPVTVALTSKFGIDSSGNPYYNAANVTDGEEAALVWDSIAGSYSLRPYYP